MIRASSAIWRPLLIVPAVCAAVGMAGCQTIDFYKSPLEEPVPPTLQPPREMRMASLPAYRIEPPDVLEIEMLKLVPLPPYRIEVFDVLLIQVVGTLMDYPIKNYYLVEGEGVVSLGPPYGKVRLAGMTVEEAREAIRRKLSEILTSPEVSVQLSQTAGTQPISGEYLVGPDGTVNLRSYGSVNVAGKTLSEAKAALERHLSQYFDSPEVAVQVLAYNSKVFYIVTAGANLGDSIVRVPITGNETVLDAISNVGGLSQLSSKRMWIARPAPDGFGYDQILPVDWDAIAQGALTQTNYQLMPDDRLFIAENETLALTNYINIMVAPFERALGIASMGASSIRNLATLGRSYNQQRF